MELIHGASLSLKEGTFPIEEGFWVIIKKKQKGIFENGEKLKEREVSGCCGIRNLEKPMGSS